MCETTTELNFETLMNLDLLGNCNLDMEMGFQQSMPDIFQDSSLVPEMSAEVLFHPGSHAMYETIPFTEELTQELQDLTNSHHYSMQPVQQHQPQLDWGLGSVHISTQPEEQQPQRYQQNWQSPILHNTTTSPVEFNYMQFNVIPSGIEHQRILDTKCVNGRKRRAVDPPCQATLDFDTTLLFSDKQNEGKQKRRRVQNARQRSAANVRERKRMNHLNDAFESLKTKVPTFSYEKRLSRMETLKLAMSYISFMTQLLDGKKSDEISLNENDPNSFSLADLGRLANTLPSSYASDGTDSSESGTSFS